MHKVNLIGLKCPMPLIKFKKFLAENPDLLDFEVHVDDPGAIKDFPVFCKRLDFSFEVAAIEPHIIIKINK